MCRSIPLFRGRRSAIQGIRQATGGFRHPPREDFSAIFAKETWVFSRKCVRAQLFCLRVYFLGPKQRLTEAEVMRERGTKRLVRWRKLLLTSE
ncbi:hypothetical protein, partial [Pseudotabrizicola algicola]|uniref:hypothetical protein n=1 Tax=Pseudotabrizicola algicola TaxID=2709381 RepID=UPI0019671EA3